MIAVIQRVRSSSVAVCGKEIAKIGKGLLVLLGVARGDSTRDAEALAERIVNVRIMADENGKMNRSVKDVNGELLVVSQFTLLADTSAGRRPSFMAAAEPETARRLYDQFIENVKIKGIPAQSGKFGAYMKVELTNDGPVTIVVNS